MADASALVKALKLFNRKERYWLIQHVLRNQPLHETFRDKFEIVLGIKIPADAYWTIDYHFDWIAGAICEFAELTKQLPNDRFKSAKTKTSLVQGTQEDIDLLIAFDNTITMVEYKAGGEWKDQLVSKERRIKSLESLVESHAKNFNIKIHPLIVCSEKKRDQDKAWLPFDAYVDKSFKRVERCDQHGKASAKGGFWHVIG